MALISKRREVDLLEDAGSRIHEVSEAYAVQNLPEIGTYREVLQFFVRGDYTKLVMTRRDRIVELVRTGRINEAYALIFPRTS